MSVLLEISGASAGLTPVSATPCDHLFAAAWSISVSDLGLGEIVDEAGEVCFRGLGISIVLSLLVPEPGGDIIKSTMKPWSASLP